METRISGSWVLSTDTSGAILSLGESDFSGRLLSLLDGLIGVDMCSAFLVERPRRLKFLLAATKHEVHRDFAERASVRYAEEFWRYDPSVANRVGTESDAYTSVFQQSKNAIKNVDYRHLCYEDPGVLDRASILGGVSNTTTVLISAYRRLSRGCFLEGEIHSLRNAAETVIALTAKHASLRAALVSLHPSVQDVVEQLGRLDARLSTREREVCAAILAGKPVKDIAREQNLQVSTVITYKKRAFLKLGIETRRDLARIYNTALIN